MLRIIAHDRKNGLTWNVTDIRFRTPSQGGEIFYIRGVTEYNGAKEAPIGAHSDYVNLAEKIELKIIEK